MAHMIDMSNDRANMAFMGETPWHGLGHVLAAGADIDTWTKAAGLNWTASMRPSCYASNADGTGAMIQSGDNFHVVRDDTHQSLGVMTGRYNPVQPAEVMAFFAQFILADDRFALETAGSLKEGKVIWALAKYCENMTCAGDEHTPYVLLTTSYNGSLATTAQATMIRVVCNNTLTASLYDQKGAMIKVPHSRRWTNEVARDAHQRLETVAHGFDHYKSLAEALAGLRMTKDQVEASLKKLLLKGKPEEETSGKAKAQLDALFQAWLTTAKETEGTTGWATLNAVTRFVDHDRNTRRTNGGITESDARMASAFYGSGAAMKKDAVAMLAEMANFELADA